MKIDKSIVVSFILLVLIASLYRIMPGRPYGFAPQIAMALFGGSIVKDKRFSFLLPLASMLFSDIIYEVLFRMNLSPMAGFYDGQLVNYLLFGGLTVIGFWVNRKRVFQVAAGSIIAATVFYLASNMLVWIGGGLALNNLPYPKTFDGLIACYTAALPFYLMSLYATLFFSALLFGGYHLVSKSSAPKTAIA